MIDGKTMANYGEKAFRLGFDVVLPVADLITDVIFTISAYIRRREVAVIIFFILSGNFALFNIPHISEAQIKKYVSIELDSYFSIIPYFNIFIKSPISYFTSFFTPSQLLKDLTLRS